MLSVKDVLKEGKGYFTYLYTEKKYGNGIDFNEIALDEEKYLQLWWREGISHGLMAWLFDCSVQKITATHTQKLLIDVAKLNHKEKNIFVYLNRDLLNKFNAYFSDDKIATILQKTGLFTYLKTEIIDKDFSLYFLNREMFYQLWWREAISDKEIGELCNMSERRIREIRTKEWLVTHPFVLDIEKGRDRFKN